MAATMFFDPVLLADGRLLVGGPYDPGIKDDGVQKVEGDVIVRFLIFAADNEDAPVEIKAQGVGTWSPDSAPVNGKPTPWLGLVTPERGLTVDTKVRAVGVAVQATKTDKDDRVPPAITSLNWCVTRQVKDEAAQELLDALTPQVLSDQPPELQQVLQELAARTAAVAP